MPPGPAFKNRPVSGLASPSFPSDGTDAVFARLVAMLRSSLHGCTVRAWDDSPNDAAPFGTEGPPSIRLTPSPGPSRIYARTARGVVHRMPLLVTIETSSPGTQVALSQRLWGAVLRGIFTGPQMDSQLQALGVSKIVVDQPGWGGPTTTKDGKLTDRCEGVGRLTLTMHFTTPE